jgi:glycosyltransferase involved in cell wall biosynthesis
MPKTAKTDSGDVLDAPFAASAGLDRKAVRVAVLVPTFKRPEQLAQTLASLAAQTTRTPYAVVVVENNAAGCEGARAAAASFAAGEVAGIAIVEPRQGNCNAYNTGFRRALAEFPDLSFVAIIDDDETADPVWLEMLEDSARTSGADIVGGPHLPIFQDRDGERRYGRHPVFWASHRATGAVNLLTSTGNCLIGAHVLRRMEPHLLDERFNFLGGGDTDFFTRCRAEGFTFHWREEALVREIVPSRRTERSWIAARSIRNGIISTIVQRRQMPGILGRLKVFAKSVALLGASPFRSAAFAVRTGSAFVGSYHMMVAAGRILAEFGYTIEQYRNPEKN